MHAALQTARASTRIELLEAMTEIRDHERRFVDDATARHLNAPSAPWCWRRSTATSRRSAVEAPPGARSTTTSRTWSASTGFGIGNAGLPAYNVLIEG